MYAPDDTSSVYGRQGTKLSPTLAAFVNGVAVSETGWNSCVSPFKQGHQKITNRFRLDYFHTLQSGQLTSGRVDENAKNHPPKLDFHCCVTLSQCQVHFHI